MNKATYGDTEFKTIEFVSGMLYKIRLFRFTQG